MRKSISKFALTAGIVLAITLSLSCSSDDSGEQPSSSSSVPGVIASSSSQNAQISSSSSVVRNSSSSAVVSSSSKASSSSTMPSSSSSVNCSLNGDPVVIGSQVWMSENLNCDVSGSRCYNDDAANCDKYGRLYNWVTAMALPANCNSTSCSDQIKPKHQGICPSGWHIPSNEDWNTLMSAVGGSSTAGRKLKATSGWSNCGPSGSGSKYVCEDAYGFAALPGGNRFSGESFHNVGYVGLWWSATESSVGYAYGKVMYHFDEDVGGDPDNKGSLSSVRCIQD